MQQHGSSGLGQPAPGSPRNTLHTAAAASAIWHNSSSSPEPPQRSTSPTRLGGRLSRSPGLPGRPGSARKSLLQSPKAVTIQQQEKADEDEAADWQSGVRHAGWLWRRFGHGHRATWKKLWVYLCDDRLCYHQPDQTLTASMDAGSSSPTASLRSKAAAAAAAAMAAASLEGGSSASHLPLVGYYGSMGSDRQAAGGQHTAMSATAASLAALAAGEVRYIALDRIPVRPLPHRQHELGPFERSHPDVGVTLVDDGVVSGKSAHIPASATFSLVSGSHTHYFAAESQRDAELWVTLIRETWLHCFSHTARCTDGSGGALTAAAAGVAVSQKLMAENALLRDSIRSLNEQVTQANGEYWRKWVEEKARNSLLESKLTNSATYELLVRTGNIKGAATDARVYIELYGPDAVCQTPRGALLGAAAVSSAASSSGNRPASPGPELACSSSPGQGGGSGCLSATADSSGEVRLFDADSAVKPFQRGATDSFTVACYNVGLPARLKVWHDNTGRYPDWFLMDIKVRKKGTRDWVNFPCNRWLSTQYEDGSISRVLQAGSGRPPVTYRVSVVTSGLRGAGTDANVHLQLHGLLGDGLQHQLLGSATAFDRGAGDEFFIDDSDLGELTAVTISHDGSGTSPAWHLDHIEVLPVPSSRPNTPSAGPLAINNSSSSPQWSQAADGSPSSVRRMSVGNSPPFGGVQQQLRKSGNYGARSGSPNPFGGQQGRQAGVGSAAAYLFPCGAWLDEALGGGLTKRRLPVASCLDAKVWYTLHITTSDIRGAGTDADVHVALTGSQGSSGIVALPSQPQHYQRGQRDKFRLQLPPLGELQKLLIGHNNQGQATSWHLSLVEVVEEESGRTTYFAADRWLGAQCGDGLSEVTLTASSTDPRQAQCEYKVCFLTSPCRGAGTDSCVSFELRGSKGSSGLITVAAGHAAFQRGGSDSFAYRRAHLGSLQQLTVWHDNSGGSAAGGRGPWCLEAVVVTCKADGQVVTFPYGGWLSADSKLKVELLPGQTKAQTRYQFDVVTSDVRGGGTDAAVSLELCGAAGSSAGPWVLDRPGAFGRGQVDSFAVEGVGVPSPTALKVTLQATQLSPSWHLAHIVCMVLEGGNDSTAGRKYCFVANRWFELTSGTASAVLPAASHLPATPQAGLQPYTVSVFTSRLGGAGTDANVCINAIGVSGSSGWRELPARQGTFDQGQEDVFTVMLPEVGRITHLGVRSDGSGHHQAWHLAKVCLQPQKQQQSQQEAGPPLWFTAQRWLDSVRGLEVLLPAQQEDPGLNLVPYQVQVYTSDTKNAGTDSRIFLQLTGEACTSPPVELQDPAAAAAGAAFQGGGVESFTLQLPVLGRLKMAAVWLEGGSSPWHLDLIVVTGPAGDQTFFVCCSWLVSSAQAPGLAPATKLATALAPVELPSSSTDPRKALQDYKVVTYTSDIRGAGTDAGVHVELFDAAGASSGRQQLSAAAGAPADGFGRGRVGEFRLRCQALGELVKLRIGHDGKGKEPVWHLSKVEVTDVAAGRTYYFAAECWLGAGPQGDGATERLLIASAKDPWADMTAYRVTVFTSSHAGAGTTAALAVTLHGSKGPPTTSSTAGGRADRASAVASTPGTPRGLNSSGRCELTVAGNEAGRVTLLAGGSCSFTLPSMHSLGQLRQLLLDVDTSQAAPWHCQHVEVTSTASGEIWLFPCNAWLGSSSSGSLAGANAQQPPSEPSRLLLPATSLEGLFRHLQEERELRQRREQYKVSVYTSAQSPTQGCVAALMLTFTAAGDETLGPVRLSRAPQPCFGAGSCEVFEVSEAAVAAGKLGALQQAKVVCELAGAHGSSWHLDTIAVTAQSTGVTTWFHAGRWFDAAAGLQAVLLGSPQDVRQQLAQYKVMVHTSDIEGAGTSAQVYMTLTGAAGSSGSLHLSHPGAVSLSGGGQSAADSTGSGSSNGFARGEAASFIFRCTALGDLQQLLVWHDGSGPHPAWHLAYVEVAETGSGAVWYFPCAQWLDSRRGDGSTRRSLRAATSFSPDSLRMRYRVRVKTGDVRGAGTDAPAFLDVFGSLGSTGPQRLNGPAASTKAAGSSSSSGKTAPPVFDRGSTCEATLSGVDVGEMSHVVVSLEPAAAAGVLLPSWWLEELEVEHLGSGQVLRFRASRWLDDKRPGCSLQYELWPGAEGGPTSRTGWQLVLFTGRGPGAGTDADVSVELHGTSGSFGPHMLPASMEAFHDGCRDTFSLETPDIRELLTLVVSHNCKGRRPAWFLHGVELTHLAPGTTYSWRVDAWLNPQQGCSRALRAAHAQRGPLQPSGAASGISSSSKSCSYQLEVQTADVEGAGTTANMFVQLGGALCEAEAVQLTSCADSSGGGAPAGHESGALFQRGCLDVFILKGMPDIGRFTHLIIGHDGTGPHPGWCLAWVRVTNLTSGATALFTGNLWLDANRQQGSQPGQTWVKLPAAPDKAPASIRQQQQQPQVLLPGQLGPRSFPVFGAAGQEVQQQQQGGSRVKGLLRGGRPHVQPGYNVTFVTSNIIWAGTSSKVFFELIGEHGSSGVVYPSGPRSSQFSRGVKVSFLYPRLPYVGKLHQLRVGTDGSGLFAAWHLHRVEVTHVHTGESWLFECNAWLDRRNTWQLLLPAGAV